MNAPWPPSAQRLPAVAPPSAPLQAMARLLRHGMAVLGEGDRLSWCNEAFSALTGHAAEEMLGGRLDTVLGWDANDGGLTAAALREALDSETSGEHVMSLCRPDGSRFWARVDLHWIGGDPAAQARWGVTLIDFSSRSLNLDELKQLLNGASLPVVVRDAGGIAVEVNLAAQALLGVPASALVAQGLDALPWRVIDAEGIDVPEDWLPEVVTLQTGQPVQDVTLGLLLPDGRRRWVRTSTALLAREAGQPPWVMTHYADVTAQHDREADLERQWRRLLSALEGSRIATWEWNQATGEIHFDDRAAQIIGVAPETLWPPTFETWRAYLHPDDEAAAQALLSEHFAGATEYYEQELRLRHADGDWRWVRDRGRLTSRLADGRPEWMYGTLEDITARKLAEVAAARDHALLQTLFDLSPIGLELIDMTMSCTLLVNRALSRIIGLPCEALMDADALRVQAPDWQAARERWFNEAVLNDRFGPAEADIVRPDGSARHLLANGVRVNVASRDHLWLTVQDVTASRVMERQLRAAAHLDRLTGLANRASLMRELQLYSERALADPAQGFAVFFLDFDRFKLVNDTLGHDAGDELLRGIAQRLRQCCEAPERAAPSPGAHPAARTAPGSAVSTLAPQQPWLPARLGGDEFVVLAAGAARREQAEQHAQHLLAALATPYTVKQQPFHSSASIGIALWQGPSDTPETLLRNADIAMYEAKRQGRRRAVYFDEAMHARIQRSALIETALREASSAGQLHLVYQPIVDLDSGERVSVEALLRWNHPTLGALSPAEFIPIAEESGQIVEIGEWVLQEACAQWARWQAEDAQAAPAVVSVNLSRVQLSQGKRLMSAVQSVLQGCAMPPAALQLEVTEREVMRDPSGMRELMLQLRELGVKMAMDDFGTGASSLGSLRDLPFDTIKIDKSFVTGLCQDMQVMTVAHATVSVIENLGMASVAEGIEDAAEVAALQAMGCRQGQGYHFARPMAPGQVLKHVRASPPGADR
ncbi:MAG: EAL domain-containing protein [Rubrivivax sp.]|nr:EAL domain-containing protein [Rubrivivax sp.]